MKLMNKHDPIKDMEIKLQKLKPKEIDDTSSDEEQTLDEKFEVK
tara:strand:- start:112 stop:243 length:132 start_codon:yes stop_codon:yes gene_type:complete